MISVLMPIRNGEVYLEAAVESILNQTFRELELVAVDDGSTDRTYSILTRYAAQDSRVRVIRTQPLGCAAAANVGLQHCSYPWVARMDADDVALPRRLERQYAMSKTDPDVVIWGTDGYHINSSGRILSSFRVGPTSKEECRRLRGEGQIVQAIHSSVLFNRQVALQVGGYHQSSFPVAEDIDLFDRMLVFGDLVTIPEPLIKYRIHSSSISMKKAARMALLRRYIHARQRHRLFTGQELSLDAFVAADRKRPHIKRLRDGIILVSSISYRKSGMHYGEGHYVRAASYLLTALTLYPVGNARRLWVQVLSSRARRNIKLYDPSG